MRAENGEKIGFATMERLRLAEGHRAPLTGKTASGRLYLWACIVAVVVLWVATMGWAVR